jgi:nickel-dependent lactate racemase
MIFNYNRAVEIPYGKNVLTFRPPEHVLGVLQCAQDAGRDIVLLMKEALTNPINKPRLSHALRSNKPRDVVVLVSDITRNIARYTEILTLLVAELVDAGIDEHNIEFIVAQGSHRNHTKEENRMLYGSLAEQFTFSPHDCRGECISLGKTSTGLEVEINRRACEAEFVIATGRIDFHYLGGFSGGRKTILPGIASYRTIRENHSKLKRDGVLVGELEGNIIAQEMQEAAQLFGIDYLVNVIETPACEPSAVVCGEAMSAFSEGVGQLLARREVAITQPADCAIIAAGGHPKDRTFFNGHRALNNCLAALKPGGAIILAVESSEGVGNERFRRCLVDHSFDELMQYPEARIELGGHRAFVTARILSDHTVYVVSQCDSSIVSQMKFIPVRDVDDGIEHLKRDYKDGYTAYVIPDSTGVLPVLQNS